MKTPEDEAFEDIERRQGGGFPAKRAMAADKLQDGKCKYCVDGCIACDARAQPAHCQCFACKDGTIHASDCAVHNGPAYPAGPCDCGVAQEPYDQTALELCEVCGWKTLIPDDGCLNCERKEKPIQQEAIYGMNQDDWKDVVAAITKVRDGRGIYLGCRPADVFQEWFLALGTAKVKEKNT